MINRLPAYLFLPLFAVLLIGALPVSVSADDLGESVLRNYPVALTIPHGRLEVSLDYMLAHRAVEDLGLHGDRGTGAGDLRGLKMLVNYGVHRYTTIMAAFTYRDQEFGLDSLSIRSVDLSFKRNLLHRRRGWVPKFAFDAGVRFNDTVGEDGMLLDAKLDGDQTARIEIDDLRDVTAYARPTAGWIWGRFFPNLFVEYGYSTIHARATAKAPDAAAGFLADLGRNESYIKCGVSLLVKFPYKALLHLEYDYLRLFRDDPLNLVHDNNIYTAELDYYLTPSLVLNMGGTWIQNQLNGRIPFLYNEFSQDRFDRRYGYAHMGLTWMFGGKSR